MSESVFLLLNRYTDEDFYQKNAELRENLPVTGRFSVEWEHAPISPMHTACQLTGQRDHYVDGFSRHRLEHALQLDPRLGARINSGTGIENPAGSMINNNACGKILMATGTYTNGGTTNNFGLIQLPNTYNFTNTGSFTNNGILKANSVAGVTNMRVVVTNACPMFSIGGSNDYTIEGIFTSPAATTSAGIYTLSGNRFVADNALLTGLQTLYATFARPSPACTVVVPFDFTNTKPTAVSVSNTTICLGNSVTLTGACSAGNLIWYTSATGSASIGSGSGLAQSPTATTTYFAACETANCAGGRVATNEVFVNLAAQPPTVSLNASTSTVCEGGSIQVVATTGGVVSGYQWYRNGQPVSGQTSATLTLVGVSSNQAGSYVLGVSGGCGSANSTSFSLIVNPLPVVTLTVPQGSTVVGPGTGIATITLPAPLTGVVMQVLGEAGLPGTGYERLIVLDRVNGFEIRQVDKNTNGIFPINRPGSFRLTVTDGNGCQRTVEGTVVVRP